MQRLRIVFGIHGHGFNAQFGDGAGDANGDFAAIGDQDASVLWRCDDVCSNSFGSRRRVAVRDLPKNGDQAPEVALLP
jgi:hypothetical protein